MPPRNAQLSTHAKLEANGRTGRRPTSHTGMCSHTTPPGNTNKTNRRPACRRCSSPMFPWIMGDGAR